MQAHRYPALLEMIRAGKLQPQKLIGKTISLGGAPQELIAMDRITAIGMTVIDQGGTSVALVS